MEIQDFLTPELLVSFVGTIIMVELLVGLTKELPIIRKIPTKLYTLILATIHLFIIKIGLNTIDLTVLGVYVLFCNAVVISVLLTGGYDIAVGKINITGLTKGDKTLKNK